MTGFVVPLTPTAVVDPSTEDFIAIEAAMLFPDEPSQREALVRSVAVEEYLDVALLAGKEATPTFVAQAALTAAPVATFREAALDRGKRGVIAGWILEELILRAHREGLVMKMTSVYQNAADAFARYWKDGLSAKTVQTAVWGKFHTVAHFWLAYSDIARGEGSLVDFSPATAIAGIQRRGIFPCDRKQFGQFLGRAEAIRRHAETTAVKQSPWGTILRPNQTARLPADLKAPDFHIRPRREN
jgi:hypothetical protein